VSAPQTGRTALMAGGLGRDPRLDLLPRPFCW